MHPALDLANPFKTSPAPSSAPHISPGESVPEKACGVGELAAANVPPAAASIPPGYVLVPIDELKCWRDDLAYYRAREQRAQLEPLPAFLSAPSASYLDAIERG